MYNYIPHPSNCRVSSAVLSLRIEEGAAGYGVYWMVLELLRDAPNFKFSRNPKALAFAINEHDIDLVARVIGNYGLFDFNDDGLLWSPWLLEAMEAYSDKKAKLQEAGRRGAAKRWAAAHGTDGQAMATPSMEDGQAMAYNVTKPNVIQQNLMLPTQGEVVDWRGVLSVQSQAVTMDYVAALCAAPVEGHAPGYVAQICQRYHISQAVCDFICERSDNANLTHPLYTKFCALVRRIEREKWHPEHPANFFLSKLFT